MRGLSGTSRFVALGHIQLDRDRQPMDYNSNGGCLRLHRQYWLTARFRRQKCRSRRAFPPSSSGSTAIKNKKKKNKKNKSKDGDSVTLGLRSRGRRCTPPPRPRFFAGAKEVNLLDAYAAWAFRISIRCSISAGSIS